MKFNKKTKLIQLIHVGKKQLGLDDDLYREVLESTTGKNSSKLLTVEQLEAVLDRMKQLGFTIESKDKAGVKKLADDAQSKLIRHLWLELYNAGEVRNGSEKALAKFIENKVKVIVNEKPLEAGVDPYNKLIDTQSDDNRMKL